MDKVKIANELVRLAKGLVAGYTIDELDKKIKEDLADVQYAIKKGNLSSSIHNAKTLLADLEEKNRLIELGLNGPYGDAIRAYGELHGLPGNSVIWMSDAVNGSEVIAMAKAALPEEYMGFKWGDLAQAVRSLPDYKYQFGRDGGPYLVVKGFTTGAEVNRLILQLKKAGAKALYLGDGLSGRQVGPTLNDSHDFSDNDWELSAAW
jgi:hypothetical protein